MHRLLAKYPFLIDLAAVVLTIILLVSQISRSGIWEPYELESAELARRLSVHLFGAGSLAQTSDPQLAPTLTDLGMGELPFTSMALAFRLFGWHDWTGRLALAIWGFVGAIALYVFLVRTLDRRTGVLGVIVLSTTPLYFMQARTMAGDIVTLASFSIAVSGLGLGLVERGKTARAISLGIGGLGLLAGFFSRGILLGVGAPLISVGLAGVLLQSARPRFSPFASALSWVLLALGVGGAARFLELAVFSPGSKEVLKRELGVLLYDANPHESTFDRVIRQIGHAAFPWSAFAPFAVGRLLVAPAGSLDGEDEARDRAAFARLTMLSGATVGLLASSLVTPYGGAMVFVGISSLAGAIAIAIAEFDRSRRHDRIIAVGTVILGIVLYVDLTRDPARALAPFIADGITAPASFRAKNESWLKAISAAFFFVLGLAWFERGSDAPAPALRRVHAAARTYAIKRYADVRELLGSVSDAWNGNLVFLLVIVEAANVGLAMMLFIGSKLNWSSITGLSSAWAKVGLSAWWIGPMAVIAGSVGYVLVLDAFDLIVRLFRTSRAMVMVVCTAAAGAWLSFGYYPAFAAELSPKGVFETFARQAGKNAQLGLLGVSERTPSFYWSGTPTVFDDANLAFPWLVHDDEVSGDTRWLVIRGRDLPRLNSMYRSRYGENLPVRDARSSQVFLAADSLGGQPNQNPLNEIVSSKAPPLQHEVHARMGDDAEALGWEILNHDGRPVRTVIPGDTYTLRLYFRALRPIGNNWQVFIHVDGGERQRHNVEHLPLEGRYPMSLWQTGDILRDDSELILEPNFVPGTYSLYFGFFHGNTRMRITEGEADDGRIVGGHLEVR